MAPPSSPHLDNQWPPSLTSDNRKLSEIQTLAWNPFTLTRVHQIRRAWFDRPLGHIVHTRTYTQPNLTCPQQPVSNRRRNTHTHKKQKTPESIISRRSSELICTIHHNVWRSEKTKPSSSDYAGETADCKHTCITSKRTCETGIQTTSSSSACSARKPESSSGHRELRWKTNFGTQIMTSKRLTILLNKQ